MSKNPKQEDEESVNKRLDTIISILLNDEIRQDTQLKKIEFLTKMSLTNEEIAKILITTKGTIEAQKYKKTNQKQKIKKSQSK